MLTKDQASLVADQLILDAKSRHDRKTLARLEARGGPMPRGITLEQFKELVAQGESHVYRGWPFALAMAACLGLLGVGVYFKALPLSAVFPVLVVLAMRLLGRKLVAKFVRETIQGDT